VTPEDEGQTHYYGDGCDEPHGQEPITLEVHDAVMGASSDLEQ
jgi:hypothetical protein